MSAQEAKQGQICGLSQHIPESNLKWPVSGIVKGEGCQDVTMPLYVADFLPNEQMLELFKPDHRVTRAIAYQPFVGMYFDKCRRKSCPKLVIPRCPERRIKRKRK